MRIFSTLGEKYQSGFCHIHMLNGWGTCFHLDGTAWDGNVKKPFYKPLPPPTEEEVYGTKAKYAII